MAGTGMQAIRGWLIWAYYLNPLAWTTYGLVASQLGDVQSLITQADGSQVSINGYVSTYYKIHFSHVGWSVLILVGFCMFFRMASAVALHYLHFQSR